MMMMMMMAKANERYAKFVRDELFVGLTKWKFGDYSEEVEQEEEVSDDNANPEAKAAPECNCHGDVYLARTTNNALTHYLSM